jgi:cytochrome c oxidase subunit 4
VSLQVSTAVYVWAYLVGSTIVEVFLFFSLPASPRVNFAITVLAASKAVFIAAYFMHLKYEPRSLRMFVFIPLFFLAALIVGMVTQVIH